MNVMNKEPPRPADSSDLSSYLQVYEMWHDSEWTDMEKMLAVTSYLVDLARRIRGIPPEVIFAFEYFERLCGSLGVCIAADRSGAYKETLAGVIREFAHLLQNPESAAIQMAPVIMEMEHDLGTQHANELQLRPDVREAIIEVVDHAFGIGSDDLEQLNLF